MRVRCQVIINEITQEEQSASPTLTIGKEYLVLAVEVRRSKNYYALVADSIDKIPTAHDARQFEITSHHIPSNWHINPGDLDIMTIGPKSWYESDFWEKCYDYDQDAIELYRKEVAIIMDEEGWTG